MSLAAQSLAIDHMAAALDEDLDGATVVITLGEQTSSPIQVAATIGAMMPDYSGDGQRRRIQRAEVQIRSSLLPSWATAEALPLSGKIQITTTGTDRGTFKIAETMVQGSLLMIKANRWPD